MDKLRWLPLPNTQSTLSDLVRHLADVSSFDQEWKDLRFAPWRFFYLDYHHIQQDKNLPERLETEWIKVYEFYILKKGEIERRSCQQEPKEQEIKILIGDIHQLYHFAKLNYCGFLSLFMQHHRLFGSGPPTDSLRRLMINKPFWDHSSDLFALIVHLNNLCIRHYPLLPMNYKKKHVYSSSSSSTTTVRSCESTTSHEKTIKKYWAHPDNIVELMLYLSSNKMILQDHQNNPSSTFMAADEIGHPQGLKSKGLQTDSIHHVKNQTKKEKFDGRIKLTTIYMDTLNLDDYTERLVDKTDTLSCTKTTRMRWYEDVPCSAIEQKIYYHQQQIRHKGHGKEPQHHYSDTGTILSWVQQRVWLKHKHIQPWLNGNYSIANVLTKASCQYRAEGTPTSITEDKQRMKQTCLQIQDEIHNKIKLPTLKSTQYRTVYASSDEQVTISIDTDIIMTRLQNQDLLRFPYCVVQIEKSGPQQGWLSKLESSPMLEPVHDFSLYLHGVGALYQVNVLPNWLSSMDKLDIRHVAYRGSLLFAKETHVPRWSSDTIATIVTCYDDDEIKETAFSPSSSCSSASSLLSPVPKQGKLRRSFDSYCSFDHPTSSKSDPTNCKSCMGKMMKENQKAYAFKKKKNNHAEVTFYSVIKNAIWRLRSLRGEKEPLLLGYKQDIETGIMNYNNYFMGFSRPTVITAACVFTSFTLSYLLYIFIMKIK